jgi:hypothetical protein
MAWVVGWTMGGRYTLIVNSVGFGRQDMAGSFQESHSDEMKLEERYRRIDKNTLELRIDDPKTSTKPWEGSRTDTQITTSGFQDQGGILFTFRRRGF